jgi:ribonuclease HI
VGIDGNEEADRLANNGAMSPEVEERDFEKETAKNERRLREKGTGTKVVDEIQFEVDCEEGDLLSEDELKRMEQDQDFS